jgi:hypothetical protein
MAKKPMRKTALITTLFCLLPWQAPQAVADAAALSIAHFPVFRRELMQNQLVLAYGDLDRQWGAPVRHVVLNSYCDSWRALHAKTYEVQSIPGHWLPTATGLGYTVLVGITYDEAQVLLLTRTKTDEQLKSLLRQQGIATPDRLAAVTSVGRQYLITQLKLGNDIRLVEMPHDDMPVLSLLQGSHQAALTSQNVYSRMQPTLKQEIRVISIPSPSLRAVFVADPAQFSKLDGARLRGLLLDVNRKSEPHGVHYVMPEAVAKLDRNGPAVDSSHCPLVP